MTLWYAGAMEVEVVGNAVKLKTYLPNSLGVEIESGGVTKLYYSHRDRLGSVMALSDEAGALSEQLAYDAWGKRREKATPSTPDSIDGQLDNKGFTGHEMLDALDLVHMNGRVYDPLIARFMSADAIIQDPEHSQSYNRYTYVWNNPTNLTDPTGFQANDPRTINSVIPAAQDSRCKQVGSGYICNAEFIDNKSDNKNGAGANRKDGSGSDIKSANSNASLVGGPYSPPEQQTNNNAQLPPGQSRTMTSGEIAMGASVYPDTDLTTVTICRCKAYFFQPSDRAMSPDGNIYFHPLHKGYYDDFSRAPVGAQRIFIHEVGHVRQTQKGENVRAAAFDRNYEYWPLVPGKTFMQYGLEQRAEMVSDYFTLMKFGRMVPDLLNQKPPPTAADYEKVVPYTYNPSGD